VFRNGPCETQIAHFGICWRTFGDNFQINQEAFVFSSQEEEFELSYGNKKITYSLKGQKLFRSKRASIYALLMLFKKFYLEFVKVS